MEAKRSVNKRAPKQKAKSGSLKGKIRGIERLLKSKGKALPDSVRKAKEEELAELKRISEGRTTRQRLTKIKRRYRRIRFYERKRLIKRREKLEALVESGEQDAAAAMEEKEQIYRDLLYIKYFPADRRYIALFPRGGHSEQAQEEINAVRADIENSIGDAKDINVDVDSDEDSEGSSAALDSDRGAQNRREHGRDTEGQNDDAGDASSDDFFVEEEDQNDATTVQPKPATPEQNTEGKRKAKAKRGVRGKRRKKSTAE